MPHSKGWRRNRSRRSSFHSGVLTRELHELLDIPYTTLRTATNSRKYVRPLKGELILRSIVKAMVSALQRGETINIRGFGIFRVETQKVRSGGTIRAAKSNGDIIGSPKISIPMKPKKRVIFYPSAHLTALINQDNPDGLNYEQKKAMLSWSPVDED